MTLKRTVGNLLDMADDGQFSMIVHGCNCHHTMGSGIARQIRERYPQAYEADRETNQGDRNKLGTVSVAIGINKLGSAFVIINAYTQFNFNSGALNDVFEYDAFQNILNGIARDAGPSMHIGMPYIGMGLAGGNKERILNIIEHFAQEISEKGGTVTLVEFG
jgi:O-acetyl-ADP-ribose deacetylase (regulator of RNase III)